MIIYQAVKENHNDMECGTYVSYGIYAVDSRTDQIVKQVHDVFVSESKAEKFISQCNKYELSPIHLLDVIDDTLSWQKYNTSKFNFQSANVTKCHIIVC